MNEDTDKALQEALAVVDALRAELASKDAVVAAKTEESREFLEEIQRLKHQIAWYKRNLFGPRSEKLSPKDVEQQLLEFARIDAELNAGSGESEPDPEVPPDPSKWSEIKSHRRKKAGGRGEIPDGLPRIREEHELEAGERGCGVCGTLMEKIGEVVREELDFVPASLFVRQHVRHKYACRAATCKDSPPVTAPPPVTVIDRGRAGPGLLGHILVSKFDDHLPLNRQEKIYQRHGVRIPRSSLCDWTASAAGVLRPLYNYLRREVLASRVLHTDDTEVPVLDPGRGKTKKGRIWTYLGDSEHPYIVFDYTPDRVGLTGPQAFLKGFEGYLQADAYAGYKELYRTSRVLEVACWAHVRRKFHEAKTADLRRSAQALGYIRALYAVERRAKDLAPDERRALRNEHARPVVERFQAWLEEAAKEVLPRGPMGEAVGYARNLEEALVRYLDDGKLAIDNNVSEREMKAVVIGRKNWMFAGSDAGGQNAAIVYSVIRSARRHGMDPYHYLVDVLRRIRTTPAEKISDLAPDKWIEERHADDHLAPTFPSA